MPKIRKQYQRGFTTLDNTPLNDEHLTWKAKGLFAYLWSKPDDWDYRVTEVAKHAVDGIGSTSTGVNELEKAGYLKRTQKNENGVFGDSVWTLSEKPIFKNPIAENPITDNASTGKPYTENPQLLNTDLLNTDKTNKRETKKDDDDTAASQADENPFDVATQAGINVNSGLHLPIFLDFIKTLGNSLVCWAIRQTDNNAQHPNWSYLLTVLKNLEANSVRTVEQAERLSEEYKQKTRRSYRGRNVPQVRETMPDWGKQDEATRTKKASASALAKARARQAKNREAKEGVKS